MLVVKRGFRGFGYFWFRFVPGKERIMHSTRSFVFVALCVGAVSATAIAQVENHPFSVHDMLAMDRLSDPQVSPGDRPRSEQGAD
jgi:hypothetical protein